jgi:hypothetical protein
MADTKEEHELQISLGDTVNQFIKFKDKEISTIRPN